MGADGYVVIGTKLNTKDFDRQIELVEDKLETLEEEYNTIRNAEPFERQEEDLKRIGNEIIKSKKELASLNKEKEKFNNIGFRGAEKELSGIGNYLNGIVKKITKWSLALIGIRSVYNGIRGAMSTLTQSDDELGARVEYIRWALANSIKPLIEWIIKAMYSILKIVGNIIQSFTGYNIFENSGIEDYQKAMNKSSKSAKELKKTLAGFDEMNVLNADGTTGTIGSSLPTPDLDLSNIKTYESAILKVTSNLIDKWFQLGEEMQWALNNPQFFDEAYGEWSKLIYGIVEIFMGLWDVITGLIEVVGGVMDIVVGIFTGNFNLVKEGWDMLCKGLWDTLKGTLEIIGGLVASVVGIIWGLIVELWNTIWGLISGIAQIVYDWVVKPVLDFFGGMWNGMVEGAKSAWQGIKNIFGAVASFFKNVFGKAWEGVKNIFSTGGRIFAGITTGILESFKRMVNAIITGINNVVAIPFNGINDAFNSLRGVDLWGWKPFEWVPTINVPRIPRLAKGAIASYPGRGIPTVGGGGNWAEAGREAYLPLTDEQIMSTLGQNIGKYVTIQLTNVTELDGRTIARKVQEVRNNDNFLMNR